MYTRMYTHMSLTTDGHPNIPVSRVSNRFIGRQVATSWNIVRIVEKELVYCACDCIISFFSLMLETLIVTFPRYIAYLVKSNFYYNYLDISRRSIRLSYVSISNIISNFCSHTIPLLNCTEIRYTWVYYLINTYKCDIITMQINLRNDNYESKIWGGGENFGNFEARDFLMGGHIWRARVTFTNIKLHGLDWDFSRRIIDLRRWCSGYFIQRNAGFLFLSRFNFSNCSCVTLSACLKLISFKCQGGNVGIFFYSLKHLLFLFLVKTREEISILSSERK